jgi:MoaA/NifB/PqqE/SkfB family radical SAM enzyme
MLPLMEVRSPLVLVLPVIDVCDGRCQMCGIWKRPARPALEPSRLARILKDVALSAALTHINITGGEPCSHPEPEALLAVLSVGCPSLREVNLNVSGLDPERTALAVPAFRAGLATAVKLVITVSLDGVGSLHDRVRGVKHAFERTMASIRWCQDAIASGLAFRLLLNCTVSRANHEGVRDVVALARQLGIGLSLTYAATNGLFLGNLSMRGRFEIAEESTRPVSQLFTDAFHDEGFPLTERHYYAMAARMANGEPRPGTCVYQDRGVFLDLDGTVYPCGTAPDLPYARLPDEPFKPAYFGERGDAIRRELMNRHCPGCPTNSYHGLAKGVWLEVLRERRSHS